MNVLDSFHLTGKRALITGSSAGIGLALAQALAQAGAHVILNGRTASKVDAAAHALQGQGLSVSSAVFDVTEADSVRAAVDQIEAEGPIEILVNNAGMQIRGPLHEYQDADWHTIMKTNLDSVYFVGQAVAKKMIPRAVARSSTSARCKASWVALASRLTLPPKVR
jgi:gluconate 5-dehydrogenase